MWCVIEGDARKVMSGMADGSVNCCVTSPPYWGLRDYGVEGQMGVEKTPEEYVAGMVEVMREVRRVLRDDGTLWLNLGDSYAAKAVEGCKRKDLVGIPWMLAFALRADGWWLRSDIIWAKPNAMPESVRDRPKASHEHVFLLTKGLKYWYDEKAVREPPMPSTLRQLRDGYDGNATKDFAAAGAQNASDVKKRIIAGKQRGHGRRHDGFNGRWDNMTKEEQQALGSKLPNVWSIAPRPYKGAHFATMPPDLAMLCIRAGCPPGGVVLDPFCGAGTTCMVAEQEGRNSIGVELNPEYCRIARERVESLATPRG